MSSSTGTTARGPYRTGIRRREQIIATAITVFGEYGYAGGSIRAIADRVGISHATLLQHFGSKEGLLTAVLEEWDRHTVEARLADVSGLGYFRRLPEVMARTSEQPGPARAVHHDRGRGIQPGPPGPRLHSAPLYRQPCHPRHTPAAGRRYRRRRTTHPGRDRHRSPPGHRRAGRDRAAMAARPLHRRHRQRRDLHQPDRRRLAQARHRDAYAFRAT